MSSQKGGGAVPLLSFDAAQDQNSNNEEAPEDSTYNFNPDGRVAVKFTGGRGWMISTIICGTTAILALALAASLGIGLGYSMHHNYSASNSTNFMLNNNSNNGNTGNTCNHNYSNSNSSNFMPNNNSTNGNSGNTCSPIYNSSNFTTTNTPHNSSVENVCTSHACVKLSSQIIGNMDESVNPCQDFYKFACNGYLKEAIIPYDQEFTSTLDIPSHEDMERIRFLMTSGNNMGLGAIQKAMNFYNTCVNTSGIEDQTLPALQQLIRNLGGWPLVGITSRTSWSMNDVQGYVSEQLYGSTAFFFWAVLPDDRNSTRNILNIVNSGLTINIPEVYQYYTTRRLLKEIIRDTLRPINPSVSYWQYDNAAQEIVNFERSISEITNFTHSKLLPQFRRNIVSLNYMRSIFPSFNWNQNMAYFARQGGFNFNRFSQVNLLSQPQYFSNLYRLIRRTESRILQNYAKWQLVLKLLPDLNSAFHDQHSSLVELTGALSDSSPRYKFCVKKVESTFKHAVARAFHDVYVLPGTFDNLTVITTELKAALEQRISSKDWLDTTTKRRALTKAKTIVEELIYPKQIAVNSFLERYYSSYEISLSSGYFVNAINTMRTARLQELGQLSVLNNRSRWILTMPPPTIVNAFYTSRHNQIYILEGILNIPFFKPYWPTFYQFGSIGFVVGHEYTHGFDNNGQLFDENGNFVNWWTPSSQHEFNRRTHCFVNQYSRYSLDAGQVDGNLTLAENIADNGGIITAYLAYKNRVNKTREVQQRLPGLSYSPDQLFFIGATQLWCKKATLKGQKAQLQDEHSPEQVRPRGFLSNNRDFAAAFNCPVGSPMNPRRKCELW